MQGKRAKRLIIGAAVTLTAAIGAFAIIGPAHAATSDITLGQTLTYTADNGGGSNTSSAGTIGAGNDNACQGGFINILNPVPASQLINGGMGGGTGATLAGTNCPVKDDSDPRGEGGLYRLMTNLWDDNTTWDCPAIGSGTARYTAANCQGAADIKHSSSLLLSTDTTKTSNSAGTQYEYNTFDANTYFPDGRPGFNATTCPQSGTFVATDGTTHGNTDLPCHWTPSQAHFPSSYPAMYKGCNFAQCSYAKGTDPHGNGSSQTNGPVANSAALPTPLSSVIGLNSHWIVNLPGGTNPVAPANGVYDVAYDIWLDRGDNTGINAFPKYSGAVGEALPGQAYNLEQNNGAEVMLWINNSGYAGHGAPDGNPAHVITPAGKFIGTYTDAKGAGWDVWVGRQNMPDTVDASGSPTKGGPLPQWNCHYAQDRVTPLTTDSSNGTNSRILPSSQNTHCTQWNIVSYVRQSGVTDFNQDTSEFMFNALNYNAGDGNLVNNVANIPAGFDLPGYLASVCPAQPVVNGTTLGNTAPGQCISPNWYLTSVQTGMEVWNLPSDGGQASAGSRLGTKFFSVNPMTVAGDPATAVPPNTGITGRDIHVIPGTPTKYHATIHFNDKWLLSYSGCPSPTANALAHYTINTTSPATSQGPFDLTQAVANSGLWESAPATPPLNPGHDDTTIVITGIPSCGDPDPSLMENVGHVFVDPSGHVITKSGMPINGATVTIGRCATANPPPNTQCPAPLLSQIIPAQVSEITPATNPADKSGPGSFRWDVVPGTYTVTASAPGCTTRTIGPLPVPPPQIGLLIVLDCAPTAPGIRAVSGGTYTAPTWNNGGGGGGGLPTNVVVRGGGIPPHGYCADVYVTNNTGAPVVWNTSFVVPGNQHIAQMWNMTLTQGGNPNVATNVHADAGSQSWNRTLQPGQTTHDNGFCTTFS